MKKIIFIIFLFVLASCQNENIFIADEEFYKIKYEDSDKHLKVAFIGDNDVYTFKGFSNEVVRLTSTPNLSKSEVKISQNGDKIGYLNEEGSLVVIDFDGNIVEQYPEITNIKEFQWINNDKSIFVLRYSNTLQVLGEPVALPSIQFPNNDQYCPIISASVSRDLDLAVIFEVEGWGSDIETQIQVFSFNQANEYSLEGSRDYPYYEVDYSNESSLLVKKEGGFSSDFRITVLFSQNSKIESFVDSYSKDIEICGEGSYALRLREGGYYEFNNILEIVNLNIDSQFVICKLQTESLQDIYIPCMDVKYIE